METANSFCDNPALNRNTRSKELIISGDIKKRLIKITGERDTILIGVQSIVECKTTDNMLVVRTSGGKKIEFRADTNHNLNKLRSRLNAALISSSCNLKFDESANFIHFDTSLEVSTNDKCKTTQIKDTNKSKINQSSGNKVVLFVIGIFIAVLSLVNWAILNQQNAKNAVSCMAENELCNDVDQKSLEPSLRIKFNKFIEIRNARIKQAKAEYVANQLIKEKDLVISRRNEAEKTKRDQATFEAEGWWEQEKGIFVRWCSDTNPCPETDTYLDSSWRAMVWCKERACGDIYAKLNITNEDVVVGWTNDTAYGDIGQKVVLTFQSSTSGKGRIVEFKARS